MMINKTVFPVHYTIFERGSNLGFYIWVILRINICVVIPKHREIFKSKPVKKVFGPAQKDDKCIIRCYNKISVSYKVTNHISTF